MKHGNNKPMLAVDCSTITASIALAVGGAVHERQVPHGRQAADLVPAIDALLKEHGVRYDALGYLLTTVGPGSFTGLRIALATVHGIALAHSIPVKAITSLQSVANTLDIPSPSRGGLGRGATNEAAASPTCSPPHPASPAKGGECAFHVGLNAGKGELFVQEFYQDGGKVLPKGDIRLMKPEQLPAGCITDRVPDAAALCRMADTLPEVPLAQVLPLYIRPPDAVPGALPPWLQTA